MKVLECAAVNVCLYQRWLGHASLKLSIIWLVLMSIISCTQHWRSHAFSGRPNTACNKGHWGKQDPHAQGLLRTVWTWLSYGGLYLMGKMGMQETESGILLHSVSFWICTWQGAEALYLPWTLTTCRSSSHYNAKCLLGSYTVTGVIHCTTNLGKHLRAEYLLFCWGCRWGFMLFCEGN